MQQVQQRMSYHQDLLDINIVLVLQAMLYRYNPYVEMFLITHERLTQNTNISLCIKLMDLSHYDSRRYNRFTANEIAVIMMRSDEERTAERDIILQA